MVVMYWWVVIAVPIVLVLVVMAGLTARSRRLTQARAIAHSERLTRLPGYRRALDRANLRVWVASAAIFAMLVVATFAGARWIYTRVDQPQKYNRDIVLCLDVSGSMVDYDAKVLDRYIEMLPGFEGERMALVLWNASAVPIFPLTDDYSFVQRELEDLAREMSYGTFFDDAGTLNAPGASLVGDGLASCVLQFDSAQAVAGEARSRSIILATDNVVNGAQTITLPQAANLARKHDITVYGLDASDQDDAYAAEYRASMQGATGQYFKLADPTSVDEIVNRITSDQTNTIFGEPQLLIVDRAEGWLFGMLALLPVVLWLVLPRGRRKEGPR